jgi:hypothetical protein
MAYPILASNIKWKLDAYKKTPAFNSVVQKNAASRGNAATSLKPYPTWTFNVELPVNVSSLSTNSSIISQFVGCFAVAQGQGGLFLYSDYTDNTIAVANSGMLDVTASSSTPMASVGNGVSTQFQLVRSLGGLAWDVIQNLNGSPVIYINGVLTSAYSISSTGVVTFNTALTSGANPTWSGNFYFLCRFGEDTFKDLSMIGYNQTGPLWSCGGISFSSEFV